MNFSFVQEATAKELEQFKSVCNQLLSRTYIVRTVYRPGKGRVNNPDYTIAASAPGRENWISGPPDAAAWRYPAP